MDYFGKDGAVADPRDHYKQNNYVICRGAMDLAAIDDFIEFYERQVIPSRRRFYRQSTEWEFHQLTSTGGMVNTLLNPHCYERQADKRLSNNVLSILASPKIHAALREVDGAASFRLYQTMLFDHTTTRPHQDWIYLDSRPNGHVIAAWLALEDIPESGIRFYVYPGTHEFRPEVGYKDAPGVKTYDYFLAEIDRFLASWDGPMYAPPLKKGDIFFWGSRIIHGSVAGTNPDQRRRSIAAHFLPEGFGTGNFGQDYHHFENRRFNGMEYCDWELKEPGILHRFARKLKNTLIR